jgi:transposase
MDDTDRQLRLRMSETRHYGPGSDSGGERWAILASLISTAKLHGVDPQTWLTDVLERIISGRTKVNALKELLPWEWKAARDAAMA